MSYDDRKGCCPDMPARERPMVQLVDLMEETNRCGMAILAMAMQIERNLFGDSEAVEEKNPAPTCLEHALNQHRSTLERAANTLGRVCARLGVRE
jgi:hypothetical protein